jgi:hypothetical protein
MVSLFSETFKFKNSQYHIGVQLMLYISCTLYLTLRAREPHELSLITVQFLAQSSLLVSRAWTALDMYIRRDYYFSNQLADLISILSLLIISLLCNGHMVSFFNASDLKLTIDQLRRCQLLWLSGENVIANYVVKYFLPMIFLTSLGMLLRFRHYKTKISQRWVSYGLCTPVYLGTP